MSSPADTEGTFEVHRSREIQRDEDLLSPDLQRELESVGSALAVIGVVALLTVSLTRAKRLIELTPFARGRPDG